MPSARDRYDAQNRRFAPTPLAEALLLLRPVRRYANIGPALASLPEPLARLIGTPVAFDADALTARLDDRGVAAADLGGALTGGVSSDNANVKARYFVIHDTSDPSPARPFPASVDTESWSRNKVASRSDLGNAHVFLARTGATATGNDYSRRKLATKFEKIEFPGAIGLFLHHELVQPRLDDPATSREDDALAPTPGFTPVQYERLAQAYLAASLRRGVYLIPAYHAVLDEDIPNGHDDPQNFDLNAWAAALQTELEAVQGAPPSTPPPAAVNRFDELVSAYAAHPIAFENLKAVTLAQWMLESGRGESNLAKLYRNFAGMKYRAEMEGIARPVPYIAHDGEDIYCAFDSVEGFIDGYWRFLERSPYRGWKEHAGAPGDFIGFIGATYSGSARYASDVLGLLPEAEALLERAGVAVAPVFVVDSPDGTLNLRESPQNSAPIRAVLPEGHPVSRLSGGAGDTWWKVRTSLNGAVYEGFVARRYLTPVGRAIPAPLHTGVVAVHLSTQTTITRTSTTGRAYPLNEAGQPRRNPLADASSRRQALDAILTWLDVEGKARYAPTGGTTFCNIYAYDYAYLAGAYLPRVWWSGGALTRLARGESVPVRYEDTVRELTANQLCDWFEEFGADFGWRRVTTAGELQQAAEDGGIGIIVAQRTQLDQPGHICAAVPADATHAPLRDGNGAIIAPVQSQAGASNQRRFAKRWWTGAQFRKFGFWVHA